MVPLASTAETHWVMAVRALRARQWLHFVLLPAATLHPGMRLENGAALASRMVRAEAIAILALAYAYGLNAVADRRTDRSHLKNPLAGVDRVPRAVAALVGATALLAAWLASGVGGIVFAATATSLVAATVYSIGPRMKAMPVLGTALNVVIFAPLLALGLQAQSSLPPAFPLLLATFVPLLVQNQLLHERADGEEDAAALALTTGRILGEGRTAFAVIALGCGGAAAAIALAPDAVLAVAATGALAAGSLAAFPIARPAPLRRRRHTAWALIGGAVTFLAQWVVR